MCSSMVDRGVRRARRRVATVDREAADGDVVAVLQEERRREVADPRRPQSQRAAGPDQGQAVAALEIETDVAADQVARARREDQRAAVRLAAIQSLSSPLTLLPQSWSIDAGTLIPATVGVGVRVGFLVGFGVARALCPGPGSASQFSAGVGLGLAVAVRPGRPVGVALRGGVAVGSKVGAVVETWASAGAELWTRGSDDSRVAVSAAGTAVRVVKPGRRTAAATTAIAMSPRLRRPGSCPSLSPGPAPWAMRTILSAARAGVST